MLGTGIRSLHSAGLWPIPQPAKIPWSILILSDKLKIVKILRAKDILSLKMDAFISALKGQPYKSRLISHLLNSYPKCHA
jgi:hypothetical protein